MLRAQSMSFSQPFHSIDRNDMRLRYPEFRRQLDALYPGALPYEEAAVCISHVLREHGFHEHNSIALVSQCRDEITKPFAAALDALWGGHSFNISSLAGFVFCGVTGFTAAMGHAPQDADGRERYVVYNGPHIAISETGEVGKVQRRGREKISSACGALIAFQGELAVGSVNVGVKPNDIEQCTLKQALVPRLKFGGAAPNLAELTQKAQESTADTCIETLEAAASGRDVPSSGAAVSGVLIHGPEGSHYFWPASVKVTQEGPRASRPGEQTVCMEVRNQVLKATRDDYVGEMFRYAKAKATAAGLLCQDCGGDVQLA